MGSHFQQPRISHSNCNIYVLIFLIQGTVFFPLPDGNGLLYNLVGTATEPKVAARITREVPCKTNAVEMLPVTNWLKKPQR